jgi:hypothetical protein
MRDRRRQPILFIADRELRKTIVSDRSAGPHLVQCLYTAHHVLRRFGHFWGRISSPSHIWPRPLLHLQRCSTLQARAQGHAVASQARPLRAKAVGAPPRRVYLDDRGLNEFGNELVGSGGDASKRSTKRTSDPILRALMAANLEIDLTPRRSKSGHSEIVWLRCLHSPSFAAKQMQSTFLLRYATNPPGKPELTAGVAPRSHTMFLSAIK